MLKRIRHQENGWESTPTEEMGMDSQEINATVMTITPELASDWLARSANNRRMSDRIVQRYAASMANGSWTVTGESIKFSRNGELIDGQHRLAAIVQSGVTIRSLVVSGVDSSAFDQMDSGKLRSSSDVLSIHGYASTHALAATVRMIVTYDWYGDFASYRQDRIGPTSAQILETLRANPMIEESVRRMGTSHLRFVGSRSLLGALHYIFSTYDSDDAEVFFERLGSGADLPKNNSIYLLRKRLIDNAASRSKLPVNDIAALTIKAWNAYRRGEPMGTLKWRAGGANPEVFPTIV